MLFAGPTLAGPMPAGTITDLRCRHGAAQQSFLPELPAARKVLQETGSVTIVALGSSATAGSGASATDKSYPAVLEAELKRRLPNAEVKVINKGVGGQSAYDMLLRMDADVIEEKPSIVIWQTVVNDVVRDVGEEKLAKILRKGIRKVHEAGIDMVVMDLQWLPREDRYPKYEDYRAVLAKTALEHAVSIFPRYAMMRNWARSKQFSSEELVGMDGLHMVDSSYRCLAIRMADGLVSGLTGEKSDFPDKPRSTN
ncbi:SGNH/GDSL hydrolase family protein [Bosea sp. 685]|uniref:SGNH/GDSL hydrolase family protein n=1 Tax=Bosea sp. 685 TaxID=3080057 RepID=UPI002892FFA4|nr:SGNH/GDSL hydrolase family protein [Bosea sp. 685]WNJ92738.1 SGNH/GDSL hydrolase family protein [Bosea sp. 685]